MKQEYIFVINKTKQVMKNQELIKAVHASIERTMLNADLSAVAKPYISKQPAIKQRNISALAMSLQRGKELVSC